jgi:hypothetical protein
MVVCHQNVRWHLTTNFPSDMANETPMSGSERTAFRAFNDLELVYTRQKTETSSSEDGDDRKPLRWKRNRSVFSPQGVR